MNVQLTTSIPSLAGRHRCSYRLRYSSDVGDLLSLLLGKHIPPDIPSHIIPTLASLKTRYASGVTLAYYFDCCLRQSVDIHWVISAAPWQQSHPEFIERLRGRLILAPLTKGDNLPFRRLCLDFGGDVGMPTMCAAHFYPIFIRCGPDIYRNMTQMDDTFVFWIRASKLRAEWSIFPGKVSGNI